VSDGLVIENDPSDDIRRLGDWLTGAGLGLVTVRPHTGEPLPADLDGYAALVVLGGGQAAGELPWRAGCESLLRKAVRHRVPTLAICLGAQLLATAHGGSVAPGHDGPEIGPALVARRDAAEWHHDEITELPAGAVLLAAATRYPHQAFRVGAAAWGLQFHIEPDAAMVAGWVETSSALLRRLGRDPDRVRADATAAMDDLAEVWQPFAARFAALARGELADAPRPTLPLLDA
jgi:GMP synthase-like glutamine amidotransferase